MSSYQNVFAHAVAVLMLGAMLLLAGCDKSGFEFGEVEGTVTLDGKPVPNADLLFLPQNIASSSPSYGRTDAQGHYKLLYSRDQSGARVAQHRVEITSQKMSDEQFEDAKARDPNTVRDFLAIPAKYAKEGQTAEVKIGKNTIDFALVK